MTGELGHLMLMLAWLAAAVQAWAGLGPRVQPRLAGAAMGWQLAGSGAAMLALAWAFVQHDFSLVYVVQHSHSSLPLAYRIAAVWGGHEGSMLLWGFVLALWSAAAQAGLQRHDRVYAARVLGVLGLVSLAILGFVLFTSNPFVRLLPGAAEGQSLNPLLQDPGLVLHPPLLYLGYVGTALPFAMTLALLWAPASPQATRLWARWARPYTAAALAFLSLGIGLGSWWAYYELGWGGWWFWDPVENASLMPWLALAALLHALAAREQRGRFVHWSAALAIIAFVLSLLGTFLVRSGVLTSVHAFASDPRRGSVMLALIAVTLLGSLALYARAAARLSEGLREQPPAAPWSRDSALAVNNLLLVVACASVLLGTLYPLALDALNLGKISVGPPYFDAVMAPLLLPMAALLLPAAWLHWGRDEAPLLRRFGPTLAAVALAAVVLPGLLQQHYGSWSVPVLLALLLALGVTVSTLHWAARRLRHGRWRDFGAGPAGMVLAHLGVAAFVVGVAMVKGHGIERDVRLAPGDRHELAGCSLQFEHMGALKGPNYESRAGRFRLACEGQPPRQLFSEKRAYVGSGMPMTESAIDAGFTRDLYVALGEEIGDGSGAWSVRVQFKPFIRWIWGGVLLMALGSFWAAAARRYRRVQPAPASRPQPPELDPMAPLPEPTP
ncbi:MAG: heme lyase CcmF/NrfE family subunit [Burkholderiaceae bacterium]|nr:heme lyase CcmF/NrfE family subunit [Burkholderiaceae bacterium]